MGAPEPILDPGDLDWILPLVRETALAFFTQSCTQQRLSADGGGPTDLGTLPCRVVPDGRQLYPLPAIPNQPVQGWQVHLPAGTDVQANDLLTLDDGRVYVVIYETEPGAYDTRRVALCVLSATGGLPLGSAYLRANTTVTCTRPGLVATGRRVHLTFAQANPAAPLEKTGAGAVSLRAVFFALADDDWTQGDGFTVEHMDGPTAPLDVTTFRLEGVVRRPLPFTCLEADLVAPLG